MLEQEQYTKYVLAEHLNTKTYEWITPLEARTTLEDLEGEIDELVRFTHERELDDAEKTYFMRGLTRKQRIPQFYGTAKVHKMESPEDPIPFRPVNSQCGSLSEIASKYVDYYLQKLIPFVPGYCLNSAHVITKFKKLHANDISHPNTLITTSDAKNMYGNIVPEICISIIQKHCDLFTYEYKEHFPKKLIIKLLKFAMTMNVFRFVDTW